MTEAPACAACGSRVLEPHFEVAGSAGPEGLIPTTDRYGTALSDVVRCPMCGHMQLERFPSEASLQQAYAGAESFDYAAEEAGQRATARVALELMERFAPERGALADLGCWLGYLVDEAGRRGWGAVGVEPSEFASRFARERLGIDVRMGGLFDVALPVGSFDVVVMADVIEHLARPAEALDRVAGLLRPDGVVYLALPDAGSALARLLGRRWWSVIPTHVQYFTRASLYTLLRRRGFEPLHASTAPKAFSVRYYLDRTGGYSRPLARALTSAARAAGVADRLWAPDFRDRMAVVARQRSETLSVCVTPST